MEIVNIETSAFIEMNNALLKIEKQLKSLETVSYTHLTLPTKRIV